MRLWTALSLGQAEVGGWCGGHGRACKAATEQPSHAGRAGTAVAKPLPFSVFPARLVARVNLPRWSSHGCSPRNWPLNGHCSPTRVSCEVVAFTQSRAGVSQNAALSGFASGP